MSRARRSRASSISTRRPEHATPEHVLVVDEAQRAYDATYDATMVRETYGDGPPSSEPEPFIRHPLAEHRGVAAGGAMCPSGAAH